MRWPKFLMFVVIAALLPYGSSIAQESVNQKLDRIDAKLDTLLAIHRSTSTILTSSGDTLRDTLNLIFGIVSPKGTILDKRYFTINHNDEWKEPYWVAYHLSANDLQGTSTRADDFRPDPQLPAGSRSELADYRGSGYDRGHNAPAADFKRSDEAMSTSFLLSNMSPQTPQLNRRIWERLESQVRQMVNAAGEAWIVTGNLFLTADSQKTTPKSKIGPDSVAVPTHCFKAILSKHQDGSYRMYAFLLPNLPEAIPGEPVNYILAVDRLEAITGYDFFPDLAGEVEAELESRKADVWP
ncbi:DNA/RNA endonuclease [candidate division GN15 bacterium]|uniref:DNA/RNA endonuclease n=1 Tax=candidate division GN15 bacterium TaxID=2072418 RepID=A0A855X494_9BACT|nr:MAG: DNA/RNA endonuclease [candidate division GN15 bacterium]